MAATPSSGKKQTASVAATAAGRKAGGKLINIDNGGTLTDICVIEGDKVWRTKTLTTPYDLSKCFLDGLTKASRAIYGEEDVQRLILGTDHIRYSTTQGTNALVERKGQRIGLVLGGGLKAADIRKREPELFDALVGERVMNIDLTLDDEALETAAVKAVNGLSSAGANRLAIVAGGADRGPAEIRLKKLLLRKFPPHLLGAIPLLYSHEVVEDDNDARRAWTAVFNAFLHPAMERFLYRAEHKLREHRATSPLLIFRNDGHSARVAKTIAIKTYSSGPRGGMEGSRALATHYGFKRLLTMDVGGTTTDIGLVEKGVVKSDRRGKVEGVEVSFPLSDVVSVGVGGSSIIKLHEGDIHVGPESVGSAPGPACFALGGTEATITDAFLVGGLLDPATFFGGELKIDADRARNAVVEKIGKGLGLNAEDAALAMETAWVAKVADSLKRYTSITPDTVLAAFGGGGPFVVCRVAEVAGIPSIVIPGLAAVFSAFGLGFSDIAHVYEAPLAAHDNASLKVALESLMQKAKRGMFGEGFELSQCQVAKSLQIITPEGEKTLALKGDALPKDLPPKARLVLALDVSRPIPQPHLSGDFKGPRSSARSSARRRVLTRAGFQDLPLYRVEDQKAGASAAGPAVLEEAFFTCRVDAGWRFTINQAGDILIERGA
ncbi:N-methylhydantoinase A/oxoprolinase/acetone carboxylase beta subunit [Panacagrimonas perspica]|uniref:N-methylhydantoinase A/oxoprolinase/acetone carboxylase beta subunit n=1 Tax=Panacagrimonas perspica TaxID=381431 RepID=A0A4R7PGJ2_9GAMM|nr:hydantoinase/oxoprolinase family protein [Panacagrimonas perspica]TDU32781.1 N-methylhydantoinase A/oxoprolinase/acetone carboxylase beta subunit [Panacagrimonas perspica]